jgi:hypothetical protein
MKTSNDEGTGATVAREPNYRSRPVPKSERRKEDRQRAFGRVEKSASVAIAYPRLKTLTVNLLYFDREIVSWGHGLRYRANMETAKSMLHFNCPSSLCNGGGFDLSKDLSSAAAERRNSIVGEMHCRGFRDQENGKMTPCESVLHFKMSLTFKTSAVPTRRITAGKSGKPQGWSRLQI